MTVQLLFRTSVAFAFVAWAVVATLYIWPQLRTQSPIDALRPLLVIHAFRSIGLSFLVPGVVWPDLPLAFARDAAYGDIVAAILALAALATLCCMSLDFKATSCEIVDKHANQHAALVSLSPRWLGHILPNENPSPPAPPARQGVILGPARDDGAAML